MMEEDDNRRGKREVRKAADESLALDCARCIKVMLAMH
jgi:hypothetical protein